MAFLNSNFVNKWFESNFQEGLHIKINQLQQIPIPKTLSNRQQPFIEKVDLMLNLNKQQHSVNRKFSNYFSGQYKIEKNPKKLENWSELTFTDFITELNKAIKTTGQTTLTKKDEFEWLDVFEENKAKAQTLKFQIESTDKEIDKMVYELYGLSEEEIEIIENS